MDKHDDIFMSISAKLDAASSAPLMAVASRTPVRIRAADGRSWQSRFRKRTQTALLAHLGGQPSATQTCLVDALVEISLELEIMKQRRDERGALTLHDARVYLAFQNSYRRHLVALGVKGAPPKVLTLQDHLQATYGSRAA